MRMNLPTRKTPLKNLDKLPALDPAYLHFLQHHEGIEITPDIDLFGYETALNENRYLSTHHADTAAQYWLIGRSGQGDEWLLDQQSAHIFFYDHNNGEYTGLLSMQITFATFLELAFLYRQLEEDAAPDESAFKASVNQLSPALYERYPYNYFE
jgi:hypothetical protein